MHLKTGVRKIGILRALNLGDLICTVPVFRAVRKSFPAAEISLIGLDWAESFCQRYSLYIDRFIAFPGYPGLPEQKVDARRILQFLHEMQAETFDLVLQLQGNGTFVNPMMTLFDSMQYAGFYLEHDYNPAPGYFLPYPETGHEIERLLKLTEFLGIPDDSTALEFPLLAEDEAGFSAIYSVLPQTFVCVHPGSKAAWRQWPLPYFAAMAGIFIRAGIAVVITGGKDETRLASELNQLMGGQAILLAGKTSLGVLALVLGRSVGLLSNCTGVSHLAAALEVPSVVISMDGEPERWAPLNHELHRTIDWTRTPHADLVESACLKLIERWKAHH